VAAVEFLGPSGAATATTVAAHATLSMATACRHCCLAISQEIKVVVVSTMLEEWSSV
jgi:hypothetical protein